MSSRQMMCHLDREGDAEPSDYAVSCRDTHRACPAFCIELILLSHKFEMLYSHS